VEISHQSRRAILRELINGSIIARNFRQFTQRSTLAFVGHAARSLVDQSTKREREREREDTYKYMRLLTPVEASGFSGAAPPRFSWINNLTAGRCEEIVWGVESPNLIQNDSREAVERLELVFSLRQPLEKPLSPSWPQSASVSDPLDGRLHLFKYREQPRAGTHTPCPGKHNPVCATMAAATIIR